MAIKSDIFDGKHILDTMRKIQESVHATTRAITEAFDAQVAAVEELTQKTEQLAAEIEKAEKSGNTQGIEEKKKAYEELSQQLEEAKKEFVDMQQAFGRQSGGGAEQGADSMKARLKSLKDEIGALTLEYRSMSESEQQSAKGQALLQKINKLTQEAGTLRDAMDDVNRSVKGVASDTKNWDALAGGINVATSAVGGFTGVAAMLGTKQEDLVEIQTKLQASLAVSNALSTIQNNLQKESNLMLGIAEIKAKAKLAAEAMATKGTIAATVAQKAFNLVAKANPYVLLATALVTVVGALYAFSKGSSAAKKKEEELAKANEKAEEKMKAFQDTLSGAMTESMAAASTISNLQVAYKNANTEFEKTAILKQAADQFNKLGLECNGVADAQRILVQQGDAVIEMLQLQGEVAALTALRMEAFKASFNRNIQNTIAEGGTITDDIITLARWEASGNDMVRGLDKQIVTVSGRLSAVKGKLRWKGGGSGRSTKKTGTGSGKGSNWNQAHANADAEEMMRDWKDELVALVEEVNQEIADANVESLEEGTEKTLRQIQEDEIKQLDAIQKQREDLIKKRRELDLKMWEKSAKGRDKYNFKAKSDAEYLTMIEAENPQLLSALTMREAQISREAQKQREEITKEIAKKEHEAMLAYLKEYGDIEQQKLAITQEYEEKIAEARKMGASPYEIASLENQRNSQLQELDSKRLEERIDWSGVFSSLEGHTKKYLEDLRNQLQSILNEGNLPVDQMAVVQDKIREINDAISQQSTMFDYIGEKAREYNRLQQEAVDAQAELIKAREEEAKAQTVLQTTQFGAKKGMNSQSAVLVAEENLRKAREKTAQATAKAKAAEDKAARTSAQKIADSFADAAKWVNTYLTDLPELLGKLGMSDASDKSKMGMDAMNDAVGAVTDFASGNYVGAALKAFSALDTLGNIVGVGGLSDPELEADIERLTASNENLQKAIDALAEQMEDASVLDIKDIYTQQMRMLAQTATQTREMMSRSGAAYNSGFWGTGIGGSGSSNKKIDEAMSASDWAMVSKAAGKAIRDAAGFWNLSSKEMYQVMRDANAQWTVIMDKANDGTADAAKFMNDYIELWKRQEALENAYRERWTSVSFDSVKDSFLSALSDMDKSAYDFSNDFQKYLFDAVMNAKVGDMLEKELKGWYDNFSKYMESGAGELTDAEISALREQWDAIVKEGVSMRNAISSATGYAGDSSEGSATYNAAKSFTQEQGDVLNGRLTAIQIAVQQGNLLRQQMVTTLGVMSGIVGGSGAAMDDVRDLMAVQNTHLEDIVTLNKRMLSEFGEKMDRMNVQLENKL